MNHKQMVQLMGKKVVVTVELERVFDSTTKDNVWDELSLDKPRVGWIVGFRWLLNGHTIRGTYDEDGLGSSCFRETGRVFAVMVAYWPTKRPTPVSKYYVDIDGHSEPRSPNVNLSIAEDWRRIMKDEMKDWPRNAKGQWVKKEKQP